MVVVTIGRLPAYMFTVYAGGKLASGRFLGAMALLGAVVVFSAVGYYEQEMIRDMVQRFADYLRSDRGVRWFGISNRGPCEERILYQTRDFSAADNSNRLRRSLRKNNRMEVVRRRALRSDRPRSAGRPQSAVAESFSVSDPGVEVAVPASVSAACSAS